MPWLMKTGLKLGEFVKWEKGELLQTATKQEFNLSYYKYLVQNYNCIINLHNTSKYAFFDTPSIHPQWGILAPPAPTVPLWPSKKVGDKCAII